MLRSWPVLKYRRYKKQDLPEDRFVITPTGVMIPDYSSYRYEKMDQQREFVRTLLDGLDPMWDFVERDPYAPVQQKSAPEELLILFRTFTDPNALPTRFYSLGNCKTRWNCMRSDRFELLRKRVFGIRNFIATSQGVILYPFWYWPCIDTLKSTIWPAFGKRTIWEVLPRDIWFIIFKSL